MAKKKIATYLHEAIESGFKHIKRRFNDLKELNSNFHAQRKWVFENVKKKADYKRRLVRVLEVLKVHSCKYLGISWLTENHICAAYGELFGETLSKRSVSTYIDHLRSLGLISTIPTKRKDGKQSANIVVMERLSEKTGEDIAHLPKDEFCQGKMKAEGTSRQEGSNTDSKAQHSTEVAHKDGRNLHTKITNPSAKTTDQEIKERNTKARPASRKPARKGKKKSERLLNFVPKWFREKIACCATETKSVYEYWKVAKHLAYGVFENRIAKEDKPAVIEESISEFYKAAKAASKGKFAMHNPYGFFHSVVEAQAISYAPGDNHAISVPFYNWLED